LNGVLPSTTTQKSAATSLQTTTRTSRTAAATEPTCAAARSGTAWPSLREPASPESTERSALTRRVESFWTLRSCGFEFSPPQRREPIAQLASIEVRGITGHGDDIRVCIGRETWRQQSRRWIPFLDGRRSALGRPRGLRLHDLELRETRLTTAIGSRGSTTSTRSRLSWGRRRFSG